MSSQADPRAEPRPALRKRAPSHPLEPPPPLTPEVEPPAKPAPPPTPAEPPDPLVPFGTRVPKSLRQRLRVLAVTTGTTEQALTIEALRLVIERHGDTAG